MSTIYLTLTEMRKLVKFAEMFQLDPEDKFEKSFAVVCDNSSGIGSTITIEANAEIAGMKGKFVHTITDEECW